MAKVDAGAVAQAIDDAKPDGIFNVLFGADLSSFVREGNTRGVFKNRTVVSLLTGEPEYLDPLKEDTPVGWIVTGYPWDEINTPGTRHSWLPIRSGGTTIHGLARSSATSPLSRSRRHHEGRLDRYRSADQGIPRPEARHTVRAVRVPRQDHQATMGAYVGHTTLKGGKGTMKSFRLVDGASVQPSDAEVAKMRPKEANE